MGRLVPAIFATGRATAVATVVAAALAAAPAAFAASDPDCAAEWTKADANADGVLTGMEADRYLAYLRIRAQVSPDNGQITQAKFMAACNADVFKAAAVDPGAPLKGETSFTETQARDRVTAAGYTGVSAMKKDDSGVWRGTAKKGGQGTPVAVDYKGNVVEK